MQVVRSLACIAALAFWGTAARADDDTAVQRRGSATSDGATPDDLDMRLTLSSFLFRESGAAGAPLVDTGATVESASPVRRYFADLRAELRDDHLAIDGRVRQTTSQRYQSGAGGGGEYELRTLSYALGGASTKLVLGRQFVDAVGATKIDGAALVQRITSTWSGTLFGGAYPALGSRSLDTDYPAIENLDGSEGAALVPLTGGFGVTYNTPDVHGDLGLAAVYVMQEVPRGADAPASEKSRVFATANGYTRPTKWLDAYHFAQVDIAGNHGVDLTNGSLGVNLHPTAALQVTTSLNHVSTELVQIAARNALADPDPNAIGIVQNDIAIVRVSQDVARAGASLAMAQTRFELSLSGGYHRRPGVSVALPDGGSLAFPETRSADATIAILDRKSVAGLRALASATLIYPLGDALPNRSRGTVVRLALGRPFRDGRAQLDLDVMAERFRDSAAAQMCTGSLDVFACFSTSKTEALQAGALGTYQLGREWLFLVDAHVGASEIAATTMDGTVSYPRVLSVTTFARVQWRYR